MGVTELQKLGARFLILLKKPFGPKNPSHVHNFPGQKFFLFLL